MAHYSYDPKDIKLLIGGVEIEPSGPVVITRNNDRTTTQVGLTGRDKCINTVRNEIGTITIPVFIQSTEDAAFDAWSSSAPNVPVPIQLLCKGANKVMNTKCWYQTSPDVTLGEEAEIRAHVLTLDDPSMSPLEIVEDIYNLFQAATI